MAIDAFLQGQGCCLSKKKVVLGDAGWFVGGFAIGFG